MGGPSDERTFERRHSPESRVFAAIPSELGRHSLLAPDSLASAARMFTEMAISFIKVAIDCALGFLDAPVVAVVDDRPCHSTKDRFDDVEELRPRRKWCGIHDRTAGGHRGLVVLFDPLEQALRNVPRSCVPRQIKLSSITVAIEEQIHHSDHLRRVLLGAVEVADLISRKFQRRRDYQASLGLLPLRHLRFLPRRRENAPRFSLNREGAELVDGKESLIGSESGQDQTEVGEFFGVFGIVRGEHKPRFAPFVSCGLGDRPDNSRACRVALFCENRAKVGHGPSRAIYPVVARRLVKKREY